MLLVDVGVITWHKNIFILIRFAFIRYMQI
jgi:hypothetical protein